MEDSSKELYINSLGEWDALYNSGLFSGYNEILNFITGKCILDSGAGLGGFATQAALLEVKYY